MNIHRGGSCQSFYSNLLSSLGLPFTTDATSASTENQKDKRMRNHRTFGRTFWSWGCHRSRTRAFTWVATSASEVNI